MTEIVLLTFVSGLAAILTGRRLNSTVSRGVIMTFTGEIKRRESPSDFWFFAVFVALMFAVTSFLAIMGAYLLLEQNL